MNKNDILGTQNWKQSQADPFLAQKIAIFCKYLYVDNVDEIYSFNPFDPLGIFQKITHFFGIPSNKNNNNNNNMIYSAPLRFVRKRDLNEEIYLCQRLFSFSKKHMTALFEH